MVNRTARRASIVLAPIVIVLASAFLETPAERGGLMTALGGTALAFEGSGGQGSGTDGPGNGPDGPGNGGGSSRYDDLYSSRFDHAAPPTTTRSPRRSRGEPPLAERPAPPPSAGADRRPPPRRAIRRTPVRAAPPPAPPPPPVPRQRANELVAFALTDADIARLAADGFVVAERITLAILGGEAVRLLVPPGTDLAAGRLAVLDVAPAAVVDVNTVYAPSAASCAGLACAQLALVAWPDAARPPATCGEGLTVAVIDTGINPDHDTLAGKDVTLLPLLGATERTSRASHGTAVAALLVGSGVDARVRGLLPRASVIAVDAFENDPHGRPLSDAFRIAAALDLVQTHAPVVVNLSLAGPPNALVERALEAVSAAGTMLVAAVGNEGPHAPPRYPAAYATVVAATAVDADRRIYRRAGRGAHVDFAAPGVGVWTAASVRGARQKTGTSFAAPFVTAALALGHARGAAGQAEAVDLLKSSAVDLGEPGHDPVFGWGLINASALCDGAAPAAAVAAAPPAADADAAAR